MGRANVLASAVVFLLALAPTTVLLTTAEAVALFLVCLPLVLLRLHPLALLVAPAVALLALDRTLRPELVLLLAVERLAFDVVGPCAERSSHLVELGLLRERDAVGVGRLQGLRVHARSHAGQKLFAELGHLLFDDFLVNAAQTESGRVNMQPGGDELTRCPRALAAIPSISLRPASCVRVPEWLGPARDASGVPRPTRTRGHSQAVACGCRRGCVVRSHWYHCHHVEDVMVESEYVNLPAARGRQTYAVVHSCFLTSSLRTREEEDAAVWRGVSTSILLQARRLRGIITLK
jgi:hypothetical protein